MQQWLEQIDVAIDCEDMETFIRADLAFHNVIINATGNRFFKQITRYLTDPIIETRRVTTRIGGIEGRQEAQKWHRAIYAAICQRDSQGAGEAMRRHMEQLEDMINRALLQLAATDGRHGHSR